VKPQASSREYEADLVVQRRENAAEGVVALTLADPDGRELPAWTPGAHVDLLLADGLVRQYSLCGSAKDRDTWRLGVLLDAGGRSGSKHVHEKLHEGSTVRVRGPRNHFPLVDSPRYQFIAGGIGITPILTMIEEAEARGADWQLLYGGRHSDSMAFVDDLAAFGDRVAIWPQDAHGVLDLEAVLGTPREDTLVYCCGPEGLLGASRPRQAPPSRPPTPSTASKSSAGAPASRSTSGPTSRSSTPSRMRASTSWRRAWRESAGRASARCSRARPTTATRCSPRPSARPVR
jgi:ferredoxin-NADP reductase